MAPKGETEYHKERECPRSNERAAPKGLPDDEAVRPPPAAWYNPTVNTRNSKHFGDSGTLRSRTAALSVFAEWDRENPVVMDPTRAVAAVASLYRLIPPDARRREDDPEFEGVGRMLDALARLGRSRG